MSDRRRLSRSTSLALVALTPALVAATPYDANPTLGAPGSPVVDGANDGEWGPEHLVYRGLANDDPRSLGGNWTMHETPWDLTHLFAAWDDTALYLAWQYVDVTDIVDPANAGSAGGSSPGRMDLIQWIALDTVSGRGAALDMWGKNAGEPYWTGPDLPDHQIYVASNLWQGYVSTAVDDVFPVDDGGVHYFSLEAAGIEIAVGPGLAVDALLGVDDADHALDEAAQRDFLALGHNPARDTFYEMRIPFAALGLDAAGLAASGLGVMIGQGEGSCLDTLPHDPATHDTPGTSPSNSPLEWGDVDTFTVPFARVATASGEPLIPNLDAGPPPDPTGDAGQTADAGGPTGEPDTAPRPDPERDAATGPAGGDDPGAPAPEVGPTGGEGGAVPPAQDAGLPVRSPNASPDAGAGAAGAAGSGGGGCALAAPESRTDTRGAPVRWVCLALGLALAWHPRRRRRGGRAPAHEP